jgi:hypothetical protein
MSSVPELQLGAPLFLFALIIVRETWQVRVGARASEPPKFQSIVPFVTYNCRPRDEDRRRKKRIAMTAVKLVDHIFKAADVVAPAGVCHAPGAPGRVDTLPSWVAWLTRLTPTEAVATLVAGAHRVPDSVYRQVEKEYNNGIAASKWPGVSELEPGQLKQLVAGLKPAIAVPAASTPVSQGNFYYIGAGVGCGIREVQQVRTVADHMCTHFHTTCCCSRRGGNTQSCCRRVTSA